MEIYPIVYHLINILIQVVLWSLIFSTPLILITIEMYLYERYKKWKDTEVKEKEKIILGRAKQITTYDEEIERQEINLKKINLDVELLEKRKKSLQDELGIEDAHDEDEQDNNIDLESMTVIQLKELAKERGLTMYSKKNRKQLIQMLS